jgi:hypothetical protein
MLETVSEPEGWSKIKAAFSVGTWRSLVAHLPWAQGVGSSNLPVPTNTDAYV